MLKCVALYRTGLESLLYRKNRNNLTQFYKTLFYVPRGTLNFAIKFEFGQFIGFYQNALHEHDIERKYLLLNLPFYCRSILEQFGNISKATWFNYSQASQDYEIIKNISQFITEIIQIGDFGKRDYK